jgi:hypothetical protein
MKGIANPLKIMRGRSILACKPSSNHRKSIWLKMSENPRLT